MTIVVTGSVATDYMMTFAGRISDSIVVDSLEKISLSFLVDNLEVRRGGTGANITFGMGLLGGSPILIAAVGEDFTDYNSWLTRHGVDTSEIYISQTQLTARFTVTTDQAHNQIASFYPGAMGEARNIELGPVFERNQGIELVLIAPDDPEAMLRHTDECRAHKVPFAADISQTLASLDGEAIRNLLVGAKYSFLNEYEMALAMKKTGWKMSDFLDNVEICVTTLGARGARIESASFAAIEVGVAKERAKVDPTGIGDAFRAGFISALGWGAGLERCAQVGSMVATYCLETQGGQEYRFTREQFLERFSESYGNSTRQDLEQLIPRSFS
ncbi:MAG: carbohydrate kinase family protein [Actinobacteria bacterium]|jgi:adenosine kinase|nr:carbohydrate kinase family protein [Actinomycetota bacterium]